ncbi:hypothetical protein L7F22_042148 [Adiantum nelumboides]|nr:hypothetical protein [Adiantum nelumboides]
MTDYVAGALSKVGINTKSSTTNSYSSTTQGSQGAKEDETQNATEILTHNQYKTSGLEKDTLSPSALTQFRAWFQDAIDHPEIPEPEAMTISTVSVQEGENGKSIARPSSRIVLLKRVDKRGFIFFTIIILEKTCTRSRYWGGFRVIPDEVEFWMGRSNRLHDRFRYTRDLSLEKDEWEINRLAP